MLGSNRKYFNLFGRIQSTQVYRHSSLRNDFLFCQDIFRASLHVTMLTEGHYGIMEQWKRNGACKGPYPASHSLHSFSLLRSDRNSSTFASRFHLTTRPRPRITVLTLRVIFGARTISVHCRSVTDGLTEDAAGIETTHVVKSDVGVIKGDLHRRLCAHIILVLCTWERAVEKRILLDVPVKFA